MAEADSAAKTESTADGDQIRLTIKTTQENHEISVPKDATVAQVWLNFSDDLSRFCPICSFQLKDCVSEKVGKPVAQLCLIFSGKILKDHENLTDHGEILSQVSSGWMNRN